MEENSKGKIVPPSKRKLMLIKKIEELRDGGYKLRSQKNFSVVLARKSQEKEKIDFWKRMKLILFDIPEFIKYNKTGDIPLSVVNVLVDMYGNVEVEEI